MIPWLSKLRAMIFSRATDPIGLYRTTLLELFFKVTFAIVIPYIGYDTIHLFIHPSTQYISWLVADLFGVCVLISFWLLNKHHYTRLAGNAFMVFFIVIATFMFDLEALDRQIIIYAIPIFTASFVLRPGSSFVYAIICSGMYSIAYFTTKTSHPEQSAEFNFVALAGIWGVAFTSFVIAKRLYSAVSDTQRARQEYQTLIEQNPAVIYTIPADAFSQTSYISPKVAELTGYSDQEWIHQPDLRLKIIHPEDRQNFLEKLGQAFKDNSQFVLDYRLIQRAGNVIWVHDEAILEDQIPGQPKLWRGLMNDITIRKMAEAASREWERRMRDMLESVKMIAIMLNTQGEVIYCNDYFLELTGLHREQVIQQNWVQNFIPAYQAGPIEQMLTDGTQGEPIPVYQESEFIIREGKRLTIQWTNTLLRDLDGEVIGITCLGADITERKHSEAALRSYAKQLEAAGNIGRALAEILELEQIYERLDWAARQFFDDLAAVSIYLYDPDQGALRCVYDALGNQAPTGQHEPPALTWDEMTPYGKAIHTRQAQIVDDLPVDQRRQVLENGLVIQETRSALCVPMLHKSRAIGVLQVQSAEHAQFTPVDAEVLSLVSNTAAIAIENARLFTETGRRLDRLNALREIDLAITASLNLHVTLDLLLDQVINQLRVSAAAVLLVNNHTQALEYAASKGFYTTMLRHTRLRVGEGLAGKAALERHVVHVANLNEEQHSFNRAPLLHQERFVTYYGVPLIAKGQVKGVLEIFNRSLLEEEPEWLSFLHTLANQAAIAIDNTTLFNDLQHSNDELMAAYDATIEGWSRALDLRDRETEGHSQRVTDLTLELARRMGIPDADLIHIRRGALLHDIGKMGIPDNILLKNGPLTTDEWKIMVTHPEAAYELLSPISFLRSALDIPYCHHEKWDGSGYPRKLRGEMIPLAARIFAIADVWDALRHDRPYRKAWDAQRICALIESEEGKHFDPAIVKVFLSLPLE